MADVPPRAAAGPLVALGLDRIEKWHLPSWAGAALCFVGLCLLLTGPGVEVHKVLTSRLASSHRSVVKHGGH